MPENLTDPELFELVETYHIHAHSRTCWKYNKNECCFPYSRYFTKTTIVAKPLDSKLNNVEKQNAKVNVIDTTSDNFTQPMSVKEILAELEVSKDDYYRSFRATF